MEGRCPGDFSCRSPAFGKLFRRHYNASEPAAGIPGGGRSPQSRAAAQSTMSCSRQSARRLRKKNSGAADRHRALALSSQFGHTEIVHMLLDARVGTTLLGAIRTRPPCIRPLWRDIAMLFDCSSSVACGWISRTPFGKEHPPSGPVTKDETKSRSFCGHGSKKGMSAAGPTRKCRPPARRVRLLR